MQNELNEFLGNDRKQFEKGELLENNTPQNPFDLFNSWLKQAIDNAIPEAYSMILGTSFDNIPNQRVVYVREIYANGFAFFSNYLSKKGTELEKNPNASILFFWPQFERQIRLHGKISISSKEISDNYFAGRPRNSQLGAWASEQSKIISSRDELNTRLSEFDKKFTNEVPRPEHWGGYCFEPSYFEFWQGRASRLHDRICYEKAAVASGSGEWKKFRVAP